MKNNDFPRSETPAAYMLMSSSKNAHHTKIRQAGRARAARDARIIHRGAETPLCPFLASIGLIILMPDIKIFTQLSLISSTVFDT